MLLALPRPMSDRFRAGLGRHIDTACETLNYCEAAFDRLVAAVRASLAAGGKLLIFGNGGSAADAQHIAAELVVRFKADRPAFAAIALTTDASILTAAGNDLGYGRIFARQVEALGRPGDVALAISTSGNSRNVLAAMETARAMGLTAAALTGGVGGALKGLADPCIVIPSADTARIQEMHICLAHLLCEAIEEALSPHA